MKFKFHRRKKDQKKALLKSLAREFFLRERIVTTEAKAKVLKDFAQRIIEKSKEKNLRKIRYLRRFFDKKIVKKLLDEIGPRYKERKGGYVRIIKLGERESDGAKMAIVELV